MTVRLLTTEEVAERFRTSPSTVRYWRHIGVGPNGIRVGRRVLYDEAECERWWQTKVATAADTRPWPHDRPWSGDAEAELRHHDAGR